MFKLWQYYFIALFFLLYFAKPIFAVTVSITNIPSEITDQPFEFNVSVTGAQSGTNYLRANFYIPNTASYFGYTFNGSDFYNGSDYSQYLPIIINSEGSGSATIKTQIDPESNSFEGPGVYGLKVRRYTSQNSYTWSNETTLTINYSTPTPTTTPTSTPTSTPTPTATPTSTPTLTNTPTTAKTSTPTKKPTPKIKQTEITIPPDLLGTSTAQLSTPSSNTDSADSPVKTSIFSFKNILLASGGAILLLAGTLFYTFIAKNRL